MKPFAAGIVSEYNPFHNGHLYHIERTRELGASHIVAVMSGNFVQRGDVAVLDKHTRAEAALLHGADLVIELPCAYALASAERFAWGAVYLLDALGCIDLISFGSESGSIAALGRAADASLSVEGTEALAEALRAGRSYPAAVQEAAASLHGEKVSALLATPNNTLGIEYLKALRRLGSSIRPLTIPRESAPHDAEVPAGRFASASHLRKLLLAGDASAERYLPGELPGEGELARFSHLEGAFLYRLRTMSADDFARIPGVSEGLENRLHEAARAAVSTGDFFARVKTKRYTLARLRRILCAALLGITKKDLQEPPPYARILGMNAAGRELLSHGQARRRIAVEGSLAKLRARGGASRRAAELEAFATDMFALARSERLPCGSDYLRKLILT